MTETANTNLSNKEEVENMKNLTVAQIIEELKKMPHDATVCICLGDNGDAYGIGQVVNNDDVVDLVLNEEL
jgi:predicted RNA-binding protein with PUA domain